MFQGSEDQEVDANTEVVDVALSASGPSESAKEVRV